MIKLEDYLDPVSIEKGKTLHLSDQSLFVRNIKVYTENVKLTGIKEYKLVILGVPDDRMSAEEGSDMAPDAIRQALYGLSRVAGKLKIADLGNLKRGKTFAVTVAALTDVLRYLRDNGVFTLLIGGSEALTPSINRLFSAEGYHYTLASVDSRIDLNPDRKESDSYNHLSQLFYEGSGSLRHFINIGYQTYLNDPQVITRLTRRHYDLIRIGDVRQAIHHTEPLLRDSDAALFDIGVVRQSDAPAAPCPSPNGLYSEEACLIARYAGISDSLKIFGLFEVNPLKDINGQTINLAAQILWFFIESYARKQHENPADNNQSSGRFTRYHINVSDMSDEMIFVKSNYTERWWMEIPDTDDGNMFVACSYEDYLSANNNEVPERWIRASARLKREG